MNMKTCTKCGQEFPETTDYFYKAEGHGDRLRGDCKGCVRERKKRYYQGNREFVDEKKREYHEKNIEKMVEYHRQYRLEYREKNYEQMKEAGKQYYQDNKDRLSEYFNDYRKNNKEKASFLCKRYRENNREKYRVYGQRRDAIARLLPNDFTVEEWLFAENYFNHECAYCGEKTKLDQDHFWPLSLGGGYTKANIIPSCKSCNSSKNNKPFEEWYPNHETYSPDREEKIREYFNSLNEREDE